MKIIDSSNKTDKCNSRNAKTAGPETARMPGTIGMQETTERYEQQEKAEGIGT
jgi:hypothetical protein